MRGREVHISEYVQLGFIKEPCDVGKFGSQLIGDFAPLRSGSVSIILRECRADESGNDAPAALSSMRQHIANAGVETATASRFRATPVGNLVRERTPCWIMSRWVSADISRSRHSVLRPLGLVRVVDSETGVVPILVRHRGRPVSNLPSLANLT